MTIYSLPLSTTAAPATVRREMDRMIQEVFAPRPTGRVAHESTGGASWTPATDASEDATGFTLRLDLPGVTPDGVAVVAEDGIVAVSGSRPSIDEADGARSLFAERATGAFQRRFRLPKSADLDAISATYAHGVLTVRVGKLAPAQPRRVDVRVDG